MHWHAKCDKHAFILYVRKIIVFAGATDIGKSFVSFVPIRLYMIFFLY